MRSLGLGGLNDSPVTGKLVSSRPGTHTLTPSLGSATSGMRGPPGAQGAAQACARHTCAWAVAPTPRPSSTLQTEPQLPSVGPTPPLQKPVYQAWGAMAAAAANSEL